MTLQALIFDVDGTLAETEECHRQAFNQTFLEFGLYWYWNKKTYARLLQTAGGKERIRQFIKEIKNDALDVVSMHARKNEIYIKNVRDGHLTLREGVKDLIEVARGMGFRLAIASTSSRENVMMMLDVLLGPTSADWFEAICCGDDVAAKKPDPDIYQMALRCLKLEPEQCIAFEDSPIGMRAALDAKLPTIITPSEYHLDCYFPDAALVLDNLSNPSSYLGIKQ